MKTNRTTFSPRFRKTWLASLLIPLFSPIHSWAAQTISVTDGPTVLISGEYGTDAEYQPAVVV
ncbi:autotransporter protein [Yersinia frederiksenii]|nr:autotransporter protein [Yersinia frederiksenii]